MTVVLNSRTVLQATDASEADSFKRLAVINRGGDYAMRRVTVSGAPG
jgi:hypothetical protein